jgi:hypothetical protein
VCGAPGGRPATACRAAGRHERRLRLRAAGRQVLQALPETPGEWEVRLGHTAVLEAALGHARVPRVRPRAPRRMRPVCAHRMLWAQRAPAPSSGAYRALSCVAPGARAQELRGAALDVLGAMSAGVSPRHAGARMRHWAGVRAALAGLGLPERAITACKHFVAQARRPALAALACAPRGSLAAAQSLRHRSPQDSWP